MITSETLFFCTKFALIKKIEICRYYNIMNGFNQQPCEVLLHIYSFTPRSYPMLRKVNRKWRETLKDVKNDMKLCVEEAILDGFRIDLGMIHFSELSDYIHKKYYNTLMCAKFTLLIEVKYHNAMLDRIYNEVVCHGLNNPLLHAQLHKLYGISVHKCSRLRCAFADELFARLITKYAARDENILISIINTNNERLITAAHASGFNFTEKTYLTSLSIKVTRLLYEFGCIFPENILTNALDRAINCAQIDLCAECRSTITFLLEHNCRITDENIDQAIVSNCQWLINELTRHKFDLQKLAKI